MSEHTTPGEGTPDATPTEALELPDRQPVTPAPASASVGSTPSGSHTRTILEVIGGVVAVGLIIVAGLGGFALGHAFGSDNDGRWSMTDSRGGPGDGPDAGGPLGGLGRDHDDRGDRPGGGPGRHGGDGADRGGDFRGGPGAMGEEGPGPHGFGNPQEDAPFAPPSSGTQG